MGGVQIYLQPNFKSIYLRGSSGIIYAYPAFSKDYEMSDLKIMYAAIGKKFEAILPLIT